MLREGGCRCSVIARSGPVLLLQGVGGSTVPSLPSGRAARPRHEDPNVA